MFVSIVLTCGVPVIWYVSQQVKRRLHILRLGGTIHCMIEEEKKKFLAQDVGCFRPLKVS